MIKLEQALMGDEQMKEERKASKWSDFPDEGPEAYHTVLKAQIDYKDFYGKDFRDHEATAVTKN